jgi:hypothetical protein
VPLNTAPMVRQTIRRSRISDQILDVVKIESHGFIPRKIGASTYLPQSGNSGLCE